MDVKSQIKATFKSNPLLYWIWFKLNKHRIEFGRIRLPLASNIFYFDGFQRSGNTYMVNLLKFGLNDEERFAHHLHTIAAIKLAFAKGVKVYILVRQPKDAIASFAIMQNYYGKLETEAPGSLHHLLDEYLNYYKFALENDNKISFIDFNPDTIDKKAFLNYFLKTYAGENWSFEKLGKTVAKFDENFTKGNASKPAERSSMPNKVRSAMKEELIVALKLQKNFVQAEELYEKVVNNAMKF